MFGSKWGSCAQNGLLERFDMKHNVLIYYAKSIKVFTENVVSTLPLRFKIYEQKMH
jgi:hypothetical protein